MRSAPAAVDAVALTRELVRFDTTNPPGAEARCVAQLARLLEDAGFALRTHELAPGRTSLVARAGGRHDVPPLCFTGHADTVPLGARPWTRDPHAGEIADGRLYGRGSTDMKSGLAAFIAAAVRLAPHLAGTPGLVLVVTAGEETGCDGARQLAGEPGALGRAGAVVVAEPTCNEPLVGHKGALWLEARTTGVTAHGSMPERGVNAVYKAARAITRLEAFRFDAAPHPALGAPTLNVGRVAGGINVNSVPDAATIGIDVRTIPSQPHAADRAHGSVLHGRLGSDARLRRPSDRRPRAGRAATRPPDGRVLSRRAGRGGRRALRRDRASLLRVLSGRRGTGPEPSNIARGSSSLA